MSTTIPANKSGPRATKLTVQIWSDVICPFCPIGDRRFQKALGQFAGRDQVEIVYRSYRLQPGVAPHSIDEYLANKFGAHQKAAPILQQVSHIAAQEGLTYRLEDTLVGDTLNAHRLLHLALTVGKHKALVERFYRSYFTEHANLFDRNSLLHLAVEAGLDEADTAAVLDSERFTAEVDADQKEAHRLGIRSVPHFLIGKRISVSGSMAPAEFLAALNRARDARAVPA